MKLIVGLGNPGKEYEKTRHNIGFMAVEDLRLKIEGFSNWKLSSPLEAEICRGHIASCCEDVILAKPQTFMNASGQSVKKLITNYKLLITDLLVIHDDLDLPLGTLRLTFGSGSAGHNGVQSIIDALGTKDFWRLRIGIGPKKGDAKQFVLKPFSRLQQLKLKKTLALTAHYVQMMFELGPQRAQTEINKAG